MCTCSSLRCIQAANLTCPPQWGNDDNPCRRFATRRSAYSWPPPQMSHFRPTTTALWGVSVGCDGPEGPTSDVCWSLGDLKACRYGVRILPLQRHTTCNASERLMYAIVYIQTLCACAHTCMAVAQEHRVCNRPGRPFREKTYNRLGASCDNPLRQAY